MSISNLFVPNNYDLYADSLTVNNLISDRLIATDPTNQLELGNPAGNNTTINAPLPAADRVYTIPDVGANANFVMTQGSQTIAGGKVFSGTLVASNGPVFINRSSGGTDYLYFRTNAGAAQWYFSSYNGVGQSNALGLTESGVADFRIYFNPGGNVSIGNNNNTYRLDVGTSSNGNCRLAGTTNQLVLGTTNTTTINSPAPTSSRTYTIEDQNGNASFLLGGGLGTTGFTQSTSILTTVNISTRIGKITMFGVVPPGNTDFSVTGAFITATSQILVWLSGDGQVSAATPPVIITVKVLSQGLASATFRITNRDGTNNSTAAPIVNYMIV
jgi:hypothetical protein